MRVSFKLMKSVLLIIILGMNLTRALATPSIGLYQGKANSGVGSGYVDPLYLMEDGTFFEYFNFFVCSQSQLGKKEKRKLKWQSGTYTIKSNKITLHPTKKNYLLNLKCTYEESVSEQAYQYRSNKNKTSCANFKNLVGIFKQTFKQPEPYQNAWQIYFGTKIYSHTSADTGEQVKELKNSLDLQLKCHKILL